MSDSAQLEVKVSDLRRRMVETGCVFEFTVSSVPSGVVVSDAHHRHALELLFGRLDEVYEQHRLNMIARDPNLISFGWSRVEFDTSLATATQLDQLEVGIDGLTSVDATRASVYRPAVRLEG